MEKIVCHADRHSHDVNYRMHQTREEETINLKCDESNITTSLEIILIELQSFLSSKRMIFRHQQ